MVFDYLPDFFPEPSLPLLVEGTDNTSLAFKQDFKKAVYGKRALVTGFPHSSPTLFSVYWRELCLFITSMEAYHVGRAE